MRLISLAELIQWLDEENDLPYIHGIAHDGEEVREIDARSASY